MIVRCLRCGREFYPLSLDAEDRLYPLFSEGIERCGRVAGAFLAARLPVHNLPDHPRLRCAGLFGERRAECPALLLKRGYLLPVRCARGRPCPVHDDPHFSEGTCHNPH